ncbi:efflux RND transporter periplasmic adaptor subunit [Hyphomicrobium sp.]|uniref:efflux RND transporter periplasmic adaptor subunit n=1 Tax=Hyphomicrobium sp. TaxID=82 RepID=UPI002D787E82|nr:efflux RND transporter periplasmic adaptor subunit [Hyphomicrobium sp.]HET6389666.1 efflux RND transporter periplasmic adaptor subunit [Hyphomicrobium sp.]
MSRSRVRSFFWLIILAGVAAGGYWAWQHRRVATQSAEMKPDPRVPVSVVTAETKNFPVYFDSLGQVQAWNTVTVRSRVDGEITKVAFEEGQFVKAGDLLIQIDPRPYQAALDQAVAKKAQDETNLANLKRDLQRFEKVGTLAITQQQIDTQRSNIAQQESLIKADVGAIANAQVQVVYTTIKAPISGRVGFRLVDQGNIIHAGDAGGVATIAQLEPIAVIFTEPEEQLPRILKELKRGPLPVTAYTSDGKQELATGELTLVDNQVDMTTGSIKLKGKFPNREHTLWPGLTVATRLLITTEKNVVVIPDAAVLRGPDKLFAYVVGPGNKAERRELVVGEIQDGQAVIQSGVKPGEKVVTSGYYRLEPGSLVDLQEDQKKEDRKQDKDRNKNQDVNQNAPRASASGSKKTVLEAE